MRYENEVTELQEKLRLISKVNKTVPNVNPDGIYGPETAEAVRAFQAQNGIVPTGRTDFDTWNAINEEHKKAIVTASDGEAIVGFSARQNNVKKGEQSETVLFIQIMLDALSPAIDGVDGIVINGVFDDKTEESVKNIQLYIDLPPTGEVDKPTWNVIVKMYNVYSHNPNYYS